MKRKLFFGKILVSILLIFIFIACQKEENKKDYQIDEVEQHIDDRDYMLQAIENDATWVLAYASEKLKADNFEYLTEDLLKSIDIKKGAILSSSDNKLKIIKDFNTYIACIVDKNKLRRFKKRKNFRT